MKGKIILTYAVGMSEDNYQYLTIIKDIITSSIAGARSVIGALPLYFFFSLLFCAFPRMIVTVVKTKLKVSYM